MLDLTKKTLTNATICKQNFVNKHAPLKKKTISENHASFVNKELGKAICTKSRLRNKMCQNPISENINSYKKKTGPYPGVSLGAPVLRKCWIRLYKQYIVMHLNKLELQTETYTRSLIQHFRVFYLN